MPLAPVSPDSNLPRAAAHYAYPGWLSSVTAAPYQWQRVTAFSSRLVARVHRGVLDALAYAESLHPDHLLAIHVAADEAEAAKVRTQWDRCDLDLDLDVRIDPYRRLFAPVMEYIDEVDDRWSDDIVTVVIPEFIVDSWWARILHNQSAVLLRARLHLRPRTVVNTVPLHVQHPDWNQQASTQPSRAEPDER